MTNTLHAAALALARADAAVVAAEKIYRSDNHKGALTERLQKLDALRNAESLRDVARAAFAGLDALPAMMINLASAMPRTDEQ